MTGTTGPGRLPVTRAVLWTSLTLGAFGAAEALLHSVVLPLTLGVVADAAITVALIIALAVVLAELTRRHHKTLAAHAVRHGKRGASAAGRHGRRGAAATARHARRHGGAAVTWLVSRAGPRWENREHQPLMVRRLRRQPERPPAEGSGEDSRDCHLCGQPLGPKDAGLAHEPCRDRVRANLTESPSTPNTEGTTMTAPSRIKTEHRARRAAARSGGTVPSEWAPVITGTADFEPDDDGELLQWMTRQVTGLSGWAEALVDFYEHATTVIGIDPQASTMLHDVADAAAQAAETMGAAKAKFTEHYELPREFAGNGGLMTHDGRWITGEGA